MLELTSEKSEVPEMNLLPEVTQQSVTDMGFKEGPLSNPVLAARTNGSQ